MTKTNINLYPKLNYAILICGLAALFYAYNFLVRVAPSTMTTELMSHFNIAADGLGVLLATFYYSYAIMQIPTGILFDRFSVRKILTTMALLCIIGLLIFTFANSIYVAAFGRLLIGFAAASASIGTLVVASRWFPEKYTLVIGFVQTLGCFGAIFGQRPIAVAVKHIGWQTTLFATALLGLVMAIMMWFFIKEEANTVTSTQPKTTYLKNIKQIFNSRQNWYLFFYGAAIWAPISIFAALWGVPFMVAHLGITTVTAATMVSAIWLGMAINGPIIGWWSDHYKQRKPQLIFSAIIGLISSTSIIYLNNIPTPIMYLLLLIFGASISGMGITFGAIKDINAAKTIGTASSILNTSMLLGGMLLQPLVGIILRYLWQGELTNKVPTYSVSSYQHALIIIPICFIICLLLSLFFIKETNCRSR